MKLDLKTREQLRELNAQQWADFKRHWPMEVFRLLADMGVGLLLGMLLGLALLLFVLWGLA